MTIRTPAIAMLASAGRNPVSGAPRACRGDAVAFMLAKGLAAGARVRVLHAGHKDEPALLDYLALGADEIEVIPAAQGGDVVPRLALALEDARLVFTGQRAETGAGSGLVPYVLAKALGWPVIANVLEVSVNAEEAIVRQFLPKGKRRTIAVGLPAVLAVHPLAPVALSYAFARKIGGRIVECERLPASPLTDVPAVEDWSVLPSSRPLTRLKAQEQKSAQARLEAAIATQASGGTVVTEGSPADKARAIVTYLRQHRLIDW